MKWFTPRLAGFPVIPAIFPVLPPSQNGVPLLEPQLQPPSELPHARQVARISMWAPPIWKDNPALCFAQL